MEKGDEGIEQELYNKAQVFLMRYMLLKGIISKSSEYVDKGYAGAFEMLASGTISVPPKINWKEIQGKVKKVTEI